MRKSKKEPDSVCNGWRIRKKLEVMNSNVTSGFFAYCRKDYKCYNVYRCDKRMSPAMRLLWERSMLF